MHQRAISLLRVGFDLDGVLARTEEATLVALIAAGVVPADATLAQLTAYNWEDSFPSIPKGFMAELFAQQEVFRDAPCDPCAIDCLSLLTESGVETHIVTLRPWEQARAVTVQWLRGFGVGYSHLHFVRERAHKAAYCQSAGLDCFIEDNLETAEMLTRHVRLSMLYDRTYNRHEPTIDSGVSVTHPNRHLIKRFYRFSEVEEFFGFRA